MHGSDEEIAKIQADTTITTPIYKVARSVKFGEEAIIIVGGEEVAIRVKTCRGRGRFRISVASSVRELRVVSRKSD